MPVSGPGAAGARENAAFAEIDSLAAPLAFAAETAIAIAALTGQVSLALGFTGHLAVVAALAWRVRGLRTARRDTGMAALTLVLTAAVGPFGALCAYGCGWFGHARGRAPGLLEAWYRRIADARATDDPSLLSDLVVAGRSIAAAGTAPAAFLAVMEHGRLAEQQAVLGLIARAFHADYLPALAAALGSAEPVVRVQAAAVATRVRARLEQQTRAVLAESREAKLGTAQSLAAAVALERYSVGGLIGGELAAAVREAIDRKVSDALQALAGGGVLEGWPTARGVRLLASLGAEERSLLESRLLAAKRFAEWRALRRFPTGPALGRSRLRRGRPRRAAGAGTS